MDQIDFDKYLAWLEEQTRVLDSESGYLTFFDNDQGPREFMETADGWSEVEIGHDDPADDFTKVEDPRLIALLNAKKAERRTN
jgi:hypothetical protein